MTGNKSAFAAIKPSHNNISVEAAFGDGARITHIGTVIVDAANGTVPCPIDDVHFIPNLRTSLLSFGSLEDQGFKFSLSNTSPSYFIARSPHGQSYNFHRTSSANIFEFGPQESNIDPLYPVSSKFSYSVSQIPRIDTSASVSHSTSPREISSSSRTTKTLKEWHRDLGHVHIGSILSLAKNPESSIRISGTKTSFFCDTCVKSGITRRYAQTPMSRSLRPLEKIHMDIGGGGRTLEDTNDHPFPSRRGARYFLIICDDATRFRWI